ncbi:MAG TPA: COX15/CtaA family protein, partial [Terriglobia bacterium]|nr:COX15/CtaA family protein [Terriglobia bacterium]
MNSAVTKRSRWLHGYAVFTAFMTFLLIIAGALVTSNDAGLSIPDWPTAFGSFKIPKAAARVMFADGHRLIAAFVAALTVILALALWAKDDRRWMKRLGAAAVLTVLAQAVLGGLAVIYGLPAFLTVAHSCIAELYFAVMVSLAIFTSPKWVWGETKIDDPLKPSLESLAVATSVIIFIQILLGAASRDDGMSVTPHMAFSAVVLAAVLYLLLRVLRLPVR